MKIFVIICTLILTSITCHSEPAGGSEKLLSKELLAPAKVMPFKNNPGISDKRRSNINVFIGQCSTNPKELKIVITSKREALLLKSFSLWMNGKKISPDYKYSETIGTLDAAVLRVKKPEDYKLVALSIIENGMGIEFFGALK